MKYFVTSDIHSFYKPLQRALKTAEFDINNPEHVLIVCGDVFDRGHETMKVYKFLKSIPEDRLVLVRGNHEDLYDALLKADFPARHDFSNGTVRTFCDIAGIDIKLLSYAYWICTLEDGGDIQELSDRAYQLMQDTWNSIVESVKNSEVTKWIQSKNWVNYYELGEYIMVHSFIPVKCEAVNTDILFNGTTQAIAAYCEYNPDWRNASANEWYFARWGCPYRFVNAGMFKEESNNYKKLVCGHWHTSSFHDIYEPGIKTNNFKIYYGPSLIALDACTASSNSCNVLIIEDGICYNKTHKKLEVKKGNSEHEYIAQYL